MKVNVSSILACAAMIIIITLNHGCSSPTDPIINNQPDTTSHNFTWQKFEFGDLYGTGMDSQIYDVAIINENDIWAVGEIYLKDSTGETNYNAVHWDGAKWELKRILFNDNGQHFWGKIYAVCAFNKDDVWFGMGSMIHWDGKSYQTIINMPYFPSTVNKMWGTSSKDFFVLGDEGNIAHYDGKNWKKIESGTTLNLLDIYSRDGKDVYISGAGGMDNSGILLKGDANGFTTIREGKNLVPRSELFNPYFSGSAASVWVSPSNTIYVAGELLCYIKEGKMDLVKSLAGNDYGLNVYGDYWGYLGNIRGNSDNDIVIVGQRNTIRHYNGVSWKQLGTPYDPSSEYTWRRVDMKGDIIAAVGWSNSNGIIMLLKRDK